MIEDGRRGPLAAAPPQRSAIVEDVDTLTDAMATCAFVRGLVERYTLADPRRREHAAKLEAIERRLNDPTLYLGVIGEFSSGKSTFINGLLRARLLKAACIATTASTTLVRRGAVFSVGARFSDGTAAAGTEDDKAELAAAVRARQPDLPSNAPLKALLEHLTSDSVVAGSVIDLEVGFPSEHLGEDLAILDTPGIGAGASTAGSHGDITRRALKEAIDCAIVLISSTSPMTGTLLDFLETYAKPFLHRCLFVITAMDRQDGAARAEVRAFVRKKLTEKLGLRDPWVLGSAAIAVLPLPTIPESLRGEREYWKGEFESLEIAVKAALARQRKLIVAESLVRLLSEVLDALKDDLLLRQKALAEEERGLEESSVAAIETLLAELRTRSETAIRSRERSLLAQTAARKETHRAAATDWVHGLVERAEAVSRPAAALAAAIDDAMTHYGRTFVDSVEGELDRLRKTCEDASAEFGQQFEASYRGLKALGVSVAVPPLAIAPMPDPTLFRSGIDFAVKQDWLDQRRKAGCATAGGIASAPLGCFLASVMAILVGLATRDPGGFILGGLLGFAMGALIGAKSGAWVGGLGGSQRQAERQSLLRVRIDPGIRSFFDQLESELGAHVRRSVEDVLEGFESAVACHLAAYGGDVERLQREHQTNRRSLETAIAQTRADGEEIKWRRGRLEVLRRRLSALAVATPGGDP